MKTFSTLDEIIENQSQSTKVQNLLNGRMYLKGIGWDDINLAPDLLEEICDKVITILGGNKETQEKLYRKLMWSKPQHWGLDRILVVDYGDGAFLEYCAGQDEVAEIKRIRTELKN